MKSLKFLGSLAVLVFFIATSVFAADQKKIVLVAGPPSHGPGEHEFRAGCLLLQDCLNKVQGINAVVYSNGWPNDPNAFDGADAIVLYMDGAAWHPALQGDHLQQLEKAVDHGAGLGCIHFAVEVPTNHGSTEWLKWIGGYFETYWSLNPMWTADFKTIPDHPATRGVKPFSIKDEWYYHMRFQPDHVTPLLSAIPPETAMKGTDAAHSGDQAELQKHKGEPQVVAWVYDRPDGGRGFGFTGAHFHTNWGNDNFRKLVLNAIVWIAKGDVPAEGIESTVTPEELKQNLDPKGRKTAVKRDGSGFEHAVIIRAKSEQDGVKAEYAWLKQHHPGYHLGKQALSTHQGKPYDILDITTAEGKDMSVYFDIAAFHGK